MNAISCRHRASWVWASLLEGRDAVKEKMQIHILNGESMKIWEDAWLPHRHIRCINTTALIPPFALVYVKDIMDIRNHTWRLDDVVYFMDVETTDMIRRIPIRMIDQLDRVI